MAEHRWGEPDKDGVPTCARNGCTVRYNGGSYWQRKRGGHWRHTHDEPLPACTGTDAPEATPCAHDWVTECGVRYCRRCPAPPPAPSPLEVARKALEKFARMGGTVWEGERKMASDGLAALATLEESIRDNVDSDIARILGARPGELLRHAAMRHVDSQRVRVIEAEASIRADERAKVLRELADEQRHAAECVRETFPERARWHDSTATGYEGEADSIRARGKR